MQSLPALGTELKAGFATLGTGLQKNVFLAAPPSNPPRKVPNFKWVKFEKLTQKPKTRKPRGILWMDEILHHLRNLVSDDALVNTNNNVPWLQSGVKWISSIHTNSSRMPPGAWRVHVHAILQHGNTPPRAGPGTERWAWRPFGVGKKAWGRWSIFRPQC